MNSDNFILNNSFNDLKEYIEKLETYALLGMCGKVLSHGYNSGMGTLRLQINNLPEEYQHIKDNFAKTTGLLYGLMDTLYISDYSSRTIVNEELIQRIFKGAKIEIINTSNAKIEFFVLETIFHAILMELFENAKKYSTTKDDIVVKLRPNIITISNDGPAPQNPDKIFNLGYKEGRGGQGFGLYICKRLLNEMGFTLNYNHVSGRNNFHIKKLK